MPTSPTIFVRAAQWLQIVIFAICFYWVQNPFTPYYPMYGLDPSWVAVAGEAAAHSAQWGRDIVLTYGPASTLITSYYTARLFPTVNILGGSIIAIVFGAAMNRLIASWSVTQCIFSTTLVVLASNLFVFQGLLFLALPMVVFLLCFRVSQGSRSTDVAAVAGAAALGLLALSKLNYGMAALPLLVLADLNWVFRRRPPLLTLAFALYAVLIYVAFGQSLAELPQFLRLHTELIKGYSEAMASDGYLAELVAILIISAIVAALIVWTETATKLARPTIELLLLFAGLAWYWFLTFKSGFVRQDLHVLITWQMIGFAAILYALARPWPLYNIATVGILALGIALLGLVAPLRLQMSEPGNTLANLGRFYYTKLVEAPRREASGLVRFVSDPGRWLAAADADKAKAWARIRAEHPLPQLAGTVDIIPSQQTVVIANGLDYRPRPSFQEYFTYTPRLVAANRDFFAGPLAPDWLLFAPGSIDGRYPSSAEGALWPDFLRRYRPEELNGDFLLLQRRERPLPDLFGRAQRVRAQVSHDIEVPDRGPVFAKIAIRKNWAGHLLGFLFRPGTVAIVVKAGGAEYSYRLIPEMARSGFLLSPFIDNNQNYLALAYGSHELLAARHVENFRIEFGRLARFAYDSALDIEFIPLRIDTKPPDR